MNSNNDYSSEDVLYTLIDQLLTLSRLNNFVITKALKELSLTTPSANLLWCLHPSLTAPSMRELAKTLGCDPSTVTFTVERLEKVGLVQRKPSPKDIRAKSVVITSKGAAVRVKLVAAMAHQTPLVNLSARQQRELMHLLAITIKGQIKDTSYMHEEKQP